MKAADYAEKARQWAHGLKLVDPTIKLVSCGHEVCPASFPVWRLLMTRAMENGIQRSYRLWLDGSTSTRSTCTPPSVRRQYLASKG
jgi:hypothetical protein